MFESFKKRKLLNLSDSTLAELEQEFKTELSTYALLGNNEMYKFLIEYYEARVEINRDRLEILDPNKEVDRPKMVAVLAENRVIRDFIKDVEEMKALYETQGALDIKG